MEIASFFNYDSAFATRLRNLISENNISKNQLSEEIGVSRQAISQYCDGSTIPNADKLLKIAEFFNVSLDYLVGRTENFTTDNELRFVCDYTGLNDENVLKLREEKRLEDALKKWGSDVAMTADEERLLDELDFSYYDAEKSFILAFLNFLLNDDNFKEVDNISKLIFHYSDAALSAIAAYKVGFLELKDTNNLRFSDYENRLRRIYDIESDFERELNISKVSLYEAVESFKSLIIDFSNKKEYDLRIQEVEKDFEVFKKTFLRGAPNANS